MQRWRLALLAVSGLLVAVLGAGLAVAINVATGGSAPWFPTMNRYPLPWTAGAAVAVAAAGLVSWWAQRWYESGSPGRESVRQRAEPRRVRVADADPLQLGVHAAISVPGMLDEVPPEYVLRDVDAAEFGLRERVADAARRGGFVLLVGGSSVGKTRSAVEAVKALLPDWWLVCPAGPGEAAVLAEPPVPRRMVVWLDELQRYLDGEHGLTAAVIRAQLAGPCPVVFIGTLWPDYYTAYNTVPASGDEDSHARERQLLDLATVIRIAPEFSPAEQDRARVAAARDSRLLVALDSPGYGLTQTLAAAPQLVARWENADPYARAVLAAALDIARLGARAPLSAVMLRAAAPGYCTSREQAQAPRNWFKQSLAYGTGTVHGAAAALVPVGAGMGQTGGYTVANYLLQHVAHERRTLQVPASTWDAILTHVSDPADAARLAGSADSRLLYRYSIPLYRQAADAGDDHAAWHLAGQLVRHGDIAELRSRAQAGDREAAFRLAGPLGDRDDIEELRSRADVGDSDALGQLVDWLGARINIRELEARANAGDMRVALRLARVMAERGDIEGLRSRAAAGDQYAALALGGRGDIGELRTRADTGDEDAAKLLATLLARRGDMEELRSRADAGEQYAAMRLAVLLAERTDIMELQARINAGDRAAGSQLPKALLSKGQGEEAERVRRFGLHPDGTIASQ